MGLSGNVGSLWLGVAEAVAAVTGMGLIESAVLWKGGSEERESAPFMRTSLDEDEAGREASATAAGFALRTVGK